ncbi:MAG: HD-GYP domain-containing protein, partial [Chromatiales bacterium]|nr:HD-GYP domain-containing protein [Chromatiales bacterium]
VAELDRPWLGTPFLFQGFPITTIDELERLRNLCEFVYIDIALSRNVPHKNTAPNPEHAHRFETKKINVSPEEHKKGYKNSVQLDIAMPEAIELHRDAGHYLNSIFKDIRLGQIADTEGARDIANRMVDNLIKNENALVLLTQLKHKDKYTELHSINVCIISVLFGSYLGLKESELRNLGLGALLHDIGKMRIPAEILNKPDKLNHDEKTIMNTHPEMGFEMLSQKENVPPIALEIAHFHHERIDGLGYPYGLSGEDIKRDVLIVALADVYDATTSDRAYHSGISPHEALKRMYDQASNHFPHTLLEKFISCLGIFPIGSIVELDSGEVGVVITTNRKHRLLPILNLVLDRKKHPLSVPQLLNMELFTQWKQPHKIQKILSSHSYGIDVRKMLTQETLTMPDSL